MLYTAYRTGIYIATHCSPSTMYKLANVYARIWYPFSGRRKRAVRSHLKALFANQNKTINSAELEQLTFRVFQEFSKYLFEVFRIPLVDKSFIQQNVRQENKGEIDEIAKSGKGAILFTAHFGNWELGGLTMALMGYPMAAVAMAHDDPHVNQLFLSRREKSGMLVIDMDQYAARECLKVLKQGKILALLGDEDFSNTSIEVDFLNEKIRVPRGPAALSRNTGVAVVPSVMVRELDNRFTIYHEKAIYPIVTDNQEDDIKKMTLSYLESLKPYFVKYPEQWYRFR